MSAPTPDTAPPPSSDWTFHVPKPHWPRRSSGGISGLAILVIYATFGFQLHDHFSGLRWPIPIPIPGPSPLPTPDPTPEPKATLKAALEKVEQDSDRKTLVLKAVHDHYVNIADNLKSGSFSSVQEMMDHIKAENQRIFPVSDREPWSVFFDAVSASWDSARPTKISDYAKLVKSVVDVTGAP